MNIKTVDFMAINAAEEFSESLKETGFAVIVNHKIPKHLLDEVYGQWQKFFNSKNKDAYSARPDHSGYFPFKSENAKGHSAKDLKEFYHVYRTEDLPLFELGGMQTMVLKEHMTHVGAGLLGWLQVTLPEYVRRDLSAPLNEMIVGSEKNLLRILHYPPLGADVAEGEVRAAAHEDINLITVLPTSTAPGLEVQDRHGIWHKVPCDPGSLVINAGDMLQLATSGFYQSTTHRVVNPVGEAAALPRFSMPLFIHPRPEVVLAPGITADSYLQERLNEILGPKNG